MNLLYEQHFGCRKAPFNITADPDFLYFSRSHSDALAQLSYALKTRRGFAVLTGEVGTGKTTVIRALARELEGDMRMALVSSHIASPTDLLCYTCAEFGLKAPKRSGDGLHEQLMPLNKFLLEAYRCGQNCSLIIDEAQNLSRRVLESIRMLSNFESPRDKLLQILLVGQPELEARLNSPQLRQLKQRIALHQNLRPLTSKECQEYIAARLRVAGAASDLFSVEGLAIVYDYSGGIPRVINVICDNSLQTAYVLRRNSVDAPIIRQVVEDLGLSTTRSSDERSAPTFAAQSNGNSHPPRSLNPPAVAAHEWRLQSEKTIDDGVTVAGVSAPIQRIVDELAYELREAMGPMASFVIQEYIRNMGPSEAGFPSEKLPSLIEAVSQEIVSPYVRQNFRTVAEERLREFF